MDDSLFTDTEERLFRGLVGLGAAGACLNAAVVMLILSHSAFRKTSHFLIVNLACADFLFDASVLITSAANLTHHQWRPDWCNFSGVTLALCGCQNLLALAAMSVDRFRTIVWNVRAPPKRTLMAIAVCWAYSTVIACCPLMGWNRVVVQPSRSYCISDWHSDALSDRLYTLWCAATLWLALLSLLLLHVWIRRYIRLTEQRVAPFLSADSSVLNLAQRRSASGRVLVIISSSLAVWFLYGFNFMYQLILAKLVPARLDLAALISIMLGSVMNPLIYVALNRNYRTAIAALLGI